MYKKIAQHPGTRKLYADKPVAQGLGATAWTMVKAFRAARWTPGKYTVDPVLTNFKSKYAVDWSPSWAKKWTDAGDTAIPLAEWKRLAERITTMPRTPSRRTSWSKKVYDDRAAMGRGEIPVDWGTGEHHGLSPRWWPSGYPVRLSGEDCGPRHLHAPPRGHPRPEPREVGRRAPTSPLQNVAENQAPFVVIDSILSEEAVLASSTATPPTTPTPW